MNGDAEMTVSDALAPHAAPDATPSSAVGGIAPPAQDDSAQDRGPARRRRSTGRRALRTVLGFAAAVVAGLIVVQLGLRVLRPHAYAGTVFPDAVAAAPLDGLAFDDGTPADLAVWRGDVVVMYFGYTSCPDVCPTTLSVLAQALDSMGDEADDVHVAMVSVDPDRDPLPLLGDYVRHFDESFVGIGGPADAIADAAALYGVFYELGEPDADGRYTVDHTATLMGIDPSGDLRVLWGPDVAADDLAADLAAMLG